MRLSSVTKPSLPVHWHATIVSVLLVPPRPSPQCDPEWNAFKERDCVFQSFFLLLPKSGFILAFPWEFGGSVWGVNTRETQTLCGLSGSRGPGLCVFALSSSCKGFSSTVFFPPILESKGSACPFMSAVVTSSLLFPPPAWWWQHYSVSKSCKTR